MHRATIAKAMDMSKKMLFVVTHAGEDPDRATIPFVMGNAALASDMSATVLLQSVGVMLGVKDYAKHVRAEGFPHLDELIQSFMDLGGKIVACSPCLKSRDITEDQLIEGVKVAAATFVVSEAADSDAIMSY